MLPSAFYTFTPLWHLVLNVWGLIGITYIALVKNNCHPFITVGSHRIIWGNIIAKANPSI